MPESTDKVVIPESTYHVIELIGTSTESWEDAARMGAELNIDNQNLTARLSRRTRELA